MRERFIPTEEFSHLNSASFILVDHLKGREAHPTVQSLDEYIMQENDITGDVKMKKLERAILKSQRLASAA